MCHYTCCYYREKCFYSSNPLINVFSILIASKLTQTVSLTFLNFATTLLLRRLFTSLVCMFLTDAMYTAISLTIGAMLVGWIYTREVQTNWGTVLDAKSYVDALNGILHLRTIRQHVRLKNVSKLRSQCLNTTFITIALIIVRNIFIKLFFFYYLSL